MRALSYLYRQDGSLRGPHDHPKTLPNLRPRTLNLSSKAIGRPTPTIPAANATLRLGIAADHCAAQHVQPEAYPHAARRAGAGAAQPGVCGAGHWDALDGLVRCGPPPTPPRAPSPDVRRADAATCCAHVRLLRCAERFGSRGLVSRPLRALHESHSRQRTCRAAHQACAHERKSMQPLRALLASPFSVASPFPADSELLNFCARAYNRKTINWTHICRLQRRVGGGSQQQGLVCPGQLKPRR
jgi:hypothetical protein